MRCIVYYIDYTSKPSSQSKVWGIDGSTMSDLRGNATLLLSSYVVLLRHGSWVLNITLYVLYLNEEWMNELICLFIIALLIAYITLLINGSGIREMSPLSVLRVVKEAGAICSGTPVVKIAICRFRVSRNVATDELVNLLYLFCQWFWNNNRKTLRKEWSLFSGPTP